MPQHPATRTPIHHVTPQSPTHLHRSPNRDEHHLNLAIDAARLAVFTGVGGAYDVSRGRSRGRHTAHITHGCTMSFLYRYSAVTDDATTSYQKCKYSRIEISPSYSAGPIHEILDTTNHTSHLRLRLSYVHRRAQSTALGERNEDLSFLWTLHLQPTTLLMWRTALAK